MEKVTTITGEMDLELRSAYPANIEGSDAFNKACEQDRVEEQNQEDLKKQVMEMVSNPAVRQNALINAQDIKKRCKGWFTIELLARKLMMQPEVVQDMLNLLCLLEFAYRRQHRDLIQYRIQFSKEDKLKVLHEELAEAEAVVNRLKAKMVEISNN